MHPTLDYVRDLVTMKGAGFYCTLNAGDEIVDMFRIVKPNNEWAMQQIGDRNSYTLEQLASLFEMESNSDRFVFLNDIVKIPDLTEIPADAEQGAYVGEDHEIFEEDRERHYTQALRDGNGNDGMRIPEQESAPDLTGRENMDFTMGDDSPKDQEVDGNVYEGDRPSIL